MAEAAPAEAVGPNADEQSRWAVPGVRGLDVAFDKLTYTVKTKKGPLNILDGMSGHIGPRQLTGLMGPSGSGKTTLMDVVAGRKNSGNITGEVLYGGTAASQKTLREICGYVEQFDTLVTELTVYQMLVYTAELKLPGKMSRKEKEERANEVIDALRLNKCRDTVIGNELNRGISGGQCKRANIALSLITKPPIVFLDEPTSGLDSSMANEVVAIIKTLAEEGRTVVATVHSPSHYAFSLFDQLMLLAVGGKTIYSGGMDPLLPYFEETFNLKFPSGEVPLPDWLVDITTEEGTEKATYTKTVMGERQTTPKDLSESWQQSARGQERTTQVSDAITRLRASPADLSGYGSQRPGEFHALYSILAFRVATHYRSGEFLGPRIGSKTFIALFTLTLYQGLGDEPGTSQIASIAATMYFFCALCGYGAAEYVPSLALDRALLYRERHDGCYTAPTYYMSKFIEEAVLSVLTSLLFTAIVFSGMQLQGSFLVFWATHYLTNMIGIVLAYFFSAIAPTMEAANAMLPSYVTTCMYFGGLILLFDEIPVWWNWYSYTSFIRYSWGLFMLNQFKDTDTGEMPVFRDQETGEDGANVLQFYGIEGDFMGSHWVHVGMLCLFIFVFGLLGMLAMTFVSHIKR